MQVSAITQVDLVDYMQERPRNNTGTKTDFAALLAEKKQAASASGVVDTSTVEIRTDITKGIDYDYLAAKYDPENMTQEEYDEFLDYLEAIGEIEKDDKLRLGYRGLILAGMTDNANISSSGYSSGILNPWIYPEDMPIYLSLQSANGNAIDWIRTMVSRRSGLVYDMNLKPLESSLIAAEKMNTASKFYKKIEEIFNDILKRR